MADQKLRIQDLPEKTTPAVSTDNVIIEDSEDSDIVKRISASQFKGDT